MGLSSRFFYGKGGRKEGDKDSRSTDGWTWKLWRWPGYIKRVEKGIQLDFVSHRICSTAVILILTRHRSARRPDCAWLPATYPSKLLQLGAPSPHTMSSALSIWKGQLSRLYLYRLSVALLVAGWGMDGMVAIRSCLYDDLDICSLIPSSTRSIYNYIPHQPLPSSFEPFIPFTHPCPMFLCLQPWPWQNPACWAPTWRQTAPRSCKGRGIAFAGFAACGRPFACRLLGWKRRSREGGRIWASGAGRN